MGEIVDWLWRWLYRLVCDDCRGFIWAWQARHGHRHTACDHAARNRLYARSVQDYGYAVAPWECPSCGQPTVLP